ncbi:hypothetical protein [Corynebacterium comes]|uniref:SPOR domain-containing protein n=1 Tax=Corynebacterium comes TaxID=2675218 RepID=A0A6B8VY43_9CORY|nr:hypothetical protein [Corynebacterium comes]QGU05081.1 hypothetical protein CETAM_09135 [Corynebacterium comes]
MLPEDEKWYFDAKTREVTQGREGAWDDRMGPYDTREEAAHALEAAAARNAAADAEDNSEDDWGKPASWDSAKK